MAKKNKETAEAEAREVPVEKAPVVGRVLVLRSGIRYPVTGEEGKWWLCGPVRYRKGNPAILRVESVTMHPVEDAEEAEDWPPEAGDP